MGWHYSEKKFQGGFGPKLAPPRHFFKCRGKSLHLKNVGVTKKGSKNRNLKKKISYALGTLKPHFVPKNQILAIYGSAQHLVRLKRPNRIIEEDWKIQKIALNWSGWFVGPNFWHR